MMKAIITFEVDKACYTKFVVSILTLTPNPKLIWSSVSGYLMNESPTFTFFLALFVYLLTPEGNIWLFSC